MRERIAKCASIKPHNSWRTKSGVLLTRTADPTTNCGGPGGRVTHRHSSTPAQRSTLITSPSSVKLTHSLRGMRAWNTSAASISPTPSHQSHRRPQRGRHPGMSTAAPRVPGSGRRCCAGRPGRPPRLNHTPPIAQPTEGPGRGEPRQRRYAAPPLLDSRDLRPEHPSRTLKRPTMVDSGESEVLPCVFYECRAAAFLVHARRERRL